MIKILYYNYNTTSTRARVYRNCTIWHTIHSKALMALVTGQVESMNIFRRIKSLDHTSFGWVSSQTKAWMSSTANQQQNILCLTQERAFIKDVSNEAAQILTSLYPRDSDCQALRICLCLCGLPLCLFPSLYVSVSGSVWPHLRLSLYLRMCELHTLHLKCANQNPPTQWRAEGLGCPWPTRFLQCSQIKIFCFFNHLPKLFILEEIFGMPPLPYPGCPAS